MRADLRGRHSSIRTARVGLNRVCRSILYHDKRHLQEMGAIDGETFLTIRRPGAKLRGQLR